MYKVIQITNPVTGEVLHVCRQSERSHKSHSLRRLVRGARIGLVGVRYQKVRALQSQGFDLVVGTVAEHLDKPTANQLVDDLRTKHDAQLSRRGVYHPRIHQKFDPDSPSLDPAQIYYVYELIRPDTNKVFYVGKGSDRHAPRISVHIRKAKAGKKGHKFSIIRKLLAAGLSPIERRVAENLMESDALKLEVKHIAEIGLELLTNDAPGGQTAPTGDNHWTRKHPEKVIRGEDHPWAKDPELGRKNVEKMQAALKADPSKRPRGAKHGMAKLTLQGVIQVRARYQQGLDSGIKVTGEQLAAEFDVTANSISRILTGQSWGLPSLIERHGNAKLSVEQRRAIEQRRAAGESYNSIAKAFSVTSNAVFTICNPEGSKSPNTTDRPGNAKLTSAQIDSMVHTFLTTDISRKQLAADYGILYSSLWRIFKKREVKRADTMSNSL